MFPKRSRDRRKTLKSLRKTASRRPRRLISNHAESKRKQLSYEFQFSDISDNLDIFLAVLMWHSAPSLRLHTRPPLGSEGAGRLKFRFDSFSHSGRYQVLLKRIGFFREMKHAGEGVRGAGGVRRRPSTTMDFYWTLKSYLGHLHGSFSISNRKNIKTAKFIVCSSD